MAQVHALAHKINACNDNQEEAMSSKASEKHMAATTSSTSKKSSEFKANAVVEGRVHIKAQDEVNIQGAREVLEMKTRHSLGKSYKVKIIGTDTRIILKRKSVVGSAPREFSLLWNEIYRFFIFERDPKLVILIIAEKPEGTRAYLLLKMKTNSEANNLCNAIQSGRKRLSSQSVQPVPASPRVAKSTEGGAAAAHEGEEEEVEMQENGKSVDKPELFNESELNSSHSEGESEEEEKVKGSTKESIPTTTTATTASEPSSRKISEPNSHDVFTKESEVQKNAISVVHSAFPGKLEHSIESEDDTSPRSLPRAPLESRTPPASPKKTKTKAEEMKKKKHDGKHRREAPVTEEMYVEPPKNWKVAQPLYARRESELREALLRDMYDDDWAVDLKLIKTDGSFGSRISDTGNVFMFTAHHLVPENYGCFECSSSSDEEVELAEKPLKKKLVTASEYSLDRTGSLNTDSEFKTKS